MRTERGKGGKFSATKKLKKFFDYGKSQILSREEFVLVGIWGEKAHKICSVATYEPRESEKLRTAAAGL